MPDHTLPPDDPSEEIRFDSTNGESDGPHDPHFASRQDQLLWKMVRSQERNIGRIEQLLQTLVNAQREGQHKMNIVATGIESSVERQIEASAKEVEVLLELKSEVAGLRSMNETLYRSCTMRSPSEEGKEIEPKQPSELEPKPSDSTLRIFVKGLARQPLPIAIGLLALAIVLLVVVQSTGLMEFLQGLFGP